LVSQAASRPDGEPRLAASTSNTLIFELAIPQPTVEEIVVDGRAFQRLTMPGYSAVGLPGQPELLEMGVVVGLPPTGAVAVRVLDQQVEDLPGAYRLYPVPEREVVVDSRTSQVDLAAGVQARWAWDASAYAVDAFQPAAVVTVGETAVVRRQRIARIAVRPLQYNPATGAVRLYRFLRVEVQFDPDAAALAAVHRTTPDAFDPLLSQWLLNGAQSSAWRLPRQGVGAQVDDAQAPAARQGEPVPGDLTRVWARVLLRQSGLYRITRAGLLAAGLSEFAASDPARLQVWRNGQQIAVDFLGNDDATFDADEALLFYGDAQPSVYTLDTVYWLTLGDAPGLRVVLLDGAPRNVAPETSLAATVRLEEDRIYRQDLPKTGSPADARWYWQELFNLANTSATLRLSLPDVSPTSLTAELRVRLMGVSYLYTNPDHQVRWTVNGQVVGAVVWDGATEASATFTFPAAWLVAGENVIEASLPMELPNVSQDRVYVDWIELSYQRAAHHPVDATTLTLDGAGPRDVALQGFHGDDIVVYDVTDPAQPRRLQGVAIESQTTAGRAASQDTQPALTPRQWASDESPAQRVFLPTIFANTPPGAYRLRFGADLDGVRSFLVTRQERALTPLRIEVDQGSQWRAPGQQADYLLVTHSSLLDAAQALAEHRRSSGMAVAVIDVQDLYDEFSDGEVDPRAVRDFVDYAYHYWQDPAPAYLLLLGDGHYDYRLVSGLARQPGLLPPYLDCFDPWLCEVASDNEFVAVSGDDRLPDLAVGRLPAADLASAEHMVAKIIAYESPTSPAVGHLDTSWQSRLLFIADNARDATGRLDAAGDFERYTEGTVAGIPASFAIERVYYDPYQADDAGESFRYRTPAATTEALVNAVNTGHLFVNYIGHAAINVWGHEWFLVGRSSVRNDVAAMTNGPRLPIFLDMACLSGNFADVVREALQETLLAHPDGGSAAGWGATGFGVAVGHDKLHTGFYRGVFELGLTRVGLAAIAGKQYLWAQDGQAHQDLLDTFGLLGDPALEIGLP
jgi:hypothetical protein